VIGIVESGSMRLSEFELLQMAGHASFDTTRNFYLAVSGDLLDRTRRASRLALEGISVARRLRAPSWTENLYDHKIRLDFT